MAEKKPKIVEKAEKRIKPKISKEIKEKLALRKTIKSKKPVFLRQEWFRYKSFGKKWRIPKGIHSKLKRHYGYRPDIPSIGYGSPKEVKFLHPSGFKDILVANVHDLEKINPSTEAARIAHTVGAKKKSQLEKRADELGIRVLNRSV